MNDRHQVTPYPLRLPGELKRELTKAAEENHRSLNMEIITRLKATLEPVATRRLEDGEENASSLKPCPFCGGEDLFVDRLIAMRCAVTCGMCGARGKICQAEPYVELDGEERDQWEPAAEAARRAWNHRA